MDKAFLREIHQAMRAGNYSERSRFIREAIYEKLEHMGIKIAERLSKSPARMGKGGRKKLAGGSKAEIIASESTSAQNRSTPFELNISGSTEPDQT